MTRLAWLIRERVETLRREIRPQRWVLMLLEGGLAALVGLLLYRTVVHPDVPMRVFLAVFWVRGIVFGLAWVGLLLFQGAYRAAPRWTLSAESWAVLRATVWMTVLGSVALLLSSPGGSGWAMLLLFPAIGLLSIAIRAVVRRLLTVRLPPIRVGRRLERIADRVRAVSANSGQLLASASGRLPRVRDLLLLVLIGAMGVSLGLVVPKSVPNSCVIILEVGALGTIAQNCDSPTIALAITDPAIYLSGETAWGSRPVYVFGVGFIRAALAWVLDPLAALLFEPIPDLEASPHTQGNLNWMATFLAMLVANVLIVATSFVLLIRILRPPDLVGRAAILVVVVTTDLVAAWFWVPHQILMNLIVPIGGTFFFILGSQERARAPRVATALGLAASVCALIYGACLTWSITFLAGRTVALVTQGLSVPRLREQLVAFACFILSFAIPILAWTALLGASSLYRPFAGSEEPGQFMWVVEAFHAGELLPEAMERVAGFWSKLLHYNGPTGIALSLVALVAVLWCVIRVGWRPTASDKVIQGSVATLVVLAVFEYFHGYWVGRLLLFPTMLSFIITQRTIGLLGRPSVAVLYSLAITSAQVMRLLTAPAISQE